MDIKISYDLLGLKMLKKGFSVAEAMIALLIGSIALGMSAPMITKQVKQNNYSNVQYSVMNKKMDLQDKKLEDAENDIYNYIDEMIAQVDGIPSGAVMYFDLAACPDGWSLLTKKYPKAENAFIRNKSGTSRALGNWQQNAAPDIVGSFDGNINDNNAYKKGPFYYDNSISYSGSDGGTGGGIIAFKASRASAVYGRDKATEVRPDNIALLACRKD